jgi:hypothetical protein
MYRTFVDTVSMSVTSFASAVDAPLLPSTAKNLRARQIEQLYFGGRAEHAAFQQKQLLTFSVNLNSQKKSIAGKWVLKSGKSGKVDLVYYIQGDSWCNKRPLSVGKGKGISVSVYTDGTDVYEVDNKGADVSKLVITH